MRKVMNGLILAMALGLAGVGLTACGDDSDGAAEHAGEQIDKAAENEKDTFDNDGPAENAGEEIDEAFDGEN